MRIFKNLTVIELVVVLAIISILTAIVIPHVGEIIHEARLSQLKDNLRKTRSVLSTFHSAHNRYPYFIRHSSGIASITRGGLAVPERAPIIPLTTDPFDELIKGALRPLPNSDTGWETRGPKYLQNPPIDPVAGIATWVFFPHAFYFVAPASPTTFDPTVHIVCIDVWPPNATDAFEITASDTNTDGAGFAINPVGQWASLASDAFSLDNASGGLLLYRSWLQGPGGGNWFPLTYRDIRSTTEGNREF